MAVHRLYQRHALPEDKHYRIKSKINEIIIKLNYCSTTNNRYLDSTEINTEFCYYIVLDKKDEKLSEDQLQKLIWLLGTPFIENDILSESGFNKFDNGGLVIEIGPRLNFSTAWSTNAVSICHSIGLNHIHRVERSTRYHIKSESNVKITNQVELDIANSLHDKMTECRYKIPLESFQLDVKPDPVFDIDVISQGRPILEENNIKLGLAFDDWDLDYYTDLFITKLKRNPTSVECFDLAQSNSEHSRHWFFKGRLFIDGKEQSNTLLEMVMGTQEHSNKNNIIKFNDNSSGIRGYNVNSFQPMTPTQSSKFIVNENSMKHIIFTAETHNFPTGVAPFPGATTGTGGRIRDVQAAGRGGHVIAASVGYCFGNLLIPGYDLPWEDGTAHYPSNFARPLEIAIQASNGASDYGNKFGEPVILGFARSFGMTPPLGERREWIKPIMFSAGIGTIEDAHIQKRQPKKGMKVVKIGGPAFRIGVGGGAASSVHVQGDNSSDLDFGAVQRGDAEMEQKLNRVIRACIELGEENPIQSIHDQGAGGNGNVLKEIVEPAGAVIYKNLFELGDPTLSTLELWAAEYQESNAVLINPTDATVLQQISLREKCPVSIVGEITGDGRIVLVDDDEAEHNNDVTSSPIKKSQKVVDNSNRAAVDLHLDLVLGKMPQKEFHYDTIKPHLRPLNLPTEVSVIHALNRVLRLPSVASKRYLTNKVDRSVTGLVAQQQCVGPLHTPLADVGVVALSHFDTVGSATSIGEQPIKCIIDPAGGARMTLSEAMLNLVFASVSDIKDVKCSGNWMWPAKLPGEGANIYRACESVCELMSHIGVAIDGGKDSLSMAARLPGTTVKAPGCLVVSAYAPCPDITVTVTPDLKCPQNQGVLIYVDVSGGEYYRLGGSALAQCYNQTGDNIPDIRNTDLLKNTFNATQQLIKERSICSGHDVSDGGVITCLLEMAFAGNKTFTVDLHHQDDETVDVLSMLFNEEAAIILEIQTSLQTHVIETYRKCGVTATVIGHSKPLAEQTEVKISVNSAEVLCFCVNELRDIWEETSFQLEKFQTNHCCVEEERKRLKHRKDPQYQLNFDPEELTLDPDQLTSLGSSRVKVAVIREEGSNGDREMAAALHMSNFEVWDVTMTDICTGGAKLDMFRGIVFVGGFSYADVLGSAKGWASSIRCNVTASTEFNRFYTRTDTFSLGVCNGCQLMALLGWVGCHDSDDIISYDKTIEQRVHLSHNKSGRFESRFATVEILPSPAVMLNGMEGSTMGIWVAHGEGQFTMANEDVHTKLIDHYLAPIRYIDDMGCITTAYPDNPNGSIDGIAALCSPDGRHLAMMPHPERCVLPWQWPWVPTDWTMNQSPWLRMFHNAYVWCKKN